MKKPPAAIADGVTGAFASEAFAMTKPMEPRTVPQLIRAAMVINGAMLMGVVVFTCAVLVKGPMQKGPTVGAGGIPILSYAMAAFGFLTLALATAVVPRLATAINRGLTTQCTDQSPEQILARTVVALNIISVAIFEGGALANLVAYLTEGRLFSIAVTGILALIMAMQFPTQDRANQWMERQKRLMAD